MKKQLLFSTALTFFFLNTFAQSERCGTMENLKLMLAKDPALRIKLDEIEKQTQELIKKRRTDTQNYNPYKETANQQTNNTQGVLSLCGYDNTSFTVIPAPTTLNQTVSPSPNCTYGGEYVRVTNIVAGRTYRISLCGANNFDTQLTVYPQGGGPAVAHNDDWCGSQSEIYFTPMSNGNYDLLVDAYNCTSNTLCATMAVVLVNIPRPKITIPVVVHVIHFGEPIGTGRNISIAQINSQIAVLNSDFRRLNADINSVPAAFKGASADPLVEFCLAQQDEFGNPTTGIERYISIMPSPNKNDMNVSIKPATIWDRNKYLNLWTVDFGAPDATLLGFAQLPGGPANTDGSCTRYTAFGNTGNVVAPFHLGRTTTHEVGHWLNLRHTWGDENACAVDDFVSDTPLQGVSSSGTPSFPVLDACTVNYPGVMFYNYMDYCDDAITTMFTYGQFARMDAALFGPRLSLQSSLGCNPSITGINEYDFDNNFSIYPNPTSRNITLKIALKQKQELNVKVYSVIGEKIYEHQQGKNETGNLDIDLNNKPDGIYFVHISSNGQTSVKKVILNKQN